MKYFSEAVDRCPSCGERVKYLLKAGQAASATGDQPQARSFANRVLQTDSKNGEAFILIGNALAAMSAGCEPAERAGAIWLAFDYYQRARALDPSVADRANERMGSCNARFPIKEELEARQLKVGVPYQVACGGLFETTTVRARK